MTGSAFIEIETDYEYVSGQMNEKAARFLMDFYHVEGDLAYTLKELAINLKETALEFIEINGIEGGRNSNLAKGIEVFVRGSAIEMRSTAYVLPTTGKRLKDSEGNWYKYGNDMVMRGRHNWGRNEDGTPVLPQAKKAHNRSQFFRGGAIYRAAASMIMPQGVDYVGATGGHYSLRSKAIKNASGDVVGRDSHKTRYNSTKNVVYYGAHVEFGHQTRDGGGIGFVQARPHLRPALRTVAEASTGTLAQTMAWMLHGLGNRFDTITHGGRQVQGLYFGNSKQLNQQTINEFVRGFGSSHKFIDQSRVTRLQEAYSVRGRRKGFGKNIDFERYGYHDETRRWAREAQRQSDPLGHQPNIPKYMDWAGNVNSARKQSHRYLQYRYPSTLPRRPRNANKKQRRVKKKQQTKVGPTHPTYLGKNITFGNIGTRQMNNIKEGNYKHRPRKIWGSRKGKRVGGRKSKKKAHKKPTYDPSIGKKSNRKENRLGKDPLRPTRPEDFYQLIAKPDKQFAKENGMTKQEWNDWKQDYHDMVQRAQELNRQHNERYQWIVEHKTEK